MAKYVFIGKNGSMGYIHGKVYHGSVEPANPTGVVFVPGIFPLNVFSNNLVIPYASYQKFTENWRAI